MAASGTRSALVDWSGGQADPAMLPAASNILEGCLVLGKHDRLALVVELGRGETVASALIHRARELGAEVEALLVSLSGLNSQRVVDELRRRLREASASMLVGSQEAFTPTIVRQLGPRGEPRRHLNLIGVTDALMLQSLRAEYEEVHELGERLRERLVNPLTLHVTSSTGTKLTVDVGGQAHWHNASGLQRGPGATWLPGGQLYTFPDTVDGMLVPDGGIGASSGWELVRPHRWRLHFKQGLLQEIEGPQQQRVKELLQELDRCPNGRRVGLVAFGTNAGILAPIGRLLQDLRMPGLYLSLGATRAEQTGATWSSSVEVPLLARRLDVKLEEEPILVRGRFARSYLSP